MFMECYGRRLEATTAPRRKGRGEDRATRGATEAIPERS